MTDDCSRIRHKRSCTKHSATVAFVHWSSVENAVKWIDEQSSQNVLINCSINALFVKAIEIIWMTIQYLILSTRIQPVNTTYDTVQRHKLIDPEMMQIRWTRRNNKESSTVM